MVSAAQWHLMALHRDIFWVGRQWAVTGSGLQAIDQRLKGVLDIDIGRLWDDDLVGRRRAMAGIKIEDFDKALEVARGRFPQPRTDAALPPPEPEPAPAPEPAAIATPVPLAAATPPAPILRAQGRLARFLPQWRIRR